MWWVRGCRLKFGDALIELQFKLFPLAHAELALSDLRWAWELYRRRGGWGEVEFAVLATGIRPLYPHYAEAMMLVASGAISTHHAENS